MDQILEKTANTIDQISDWIGKQVSWLTTALVILVCFDVITRYTFSDTSAWIMELEWHLFALIFLFGAGFAFRHDKHVRVDLFYARFAARDQALVNIIGALVFLIPWCLILIYQTYNFALVSFKDGETSPDPGGLPALWVIKFCISIGLFFLLLQAISSLCRNLVIYRAKED